MYSTRYYVYEARRVPFARRVKVIEQFWCRFSGLTHSHTHTMYTRILTYTDIHTHTFPSYRVTPGGKLSLAHSLSHSLFLSLTHTNFLGNAFAGSLIIHHYYQSTATHCHRRLLAPSSTLKPVTDGPPLCYFYSFFLYFVRVFHSTHTHTQPGMYTSARTLAGG